MLSRFGLALTSLLLAVSLAEIAVRIMGFHGSKNFDLRDTISVDDPVLNWRHKPESVFYFNDVRYEINRKGFRDRDYPETRPVNTYRIFLASDSVGFGANVRLEDNYPKLFGAATQLLRPFLPHRGFEPQHAGAFDQAEIPSGKTLRQKVFRRPHLNRLRG